MRLDQFVSEKFAYSRTKAQQLIESGFVSVNNLTQNKVSYKIKESDKVEIISSFQFASLGGDKLYKAFNDFNYSVKNKVCLDIGASNGGFTDCMLQNGAKKVYALDVGECALEKKIKNNPNVIVKDRTNARSVTWEEIGEKCDFASIDVSFISLKLILPNAYNLIKDDGEIIALIKPQFEAGKKYLSKKGIVTSQKVIDNIIQDIKDFAIQTKFKVVNITNAPIKENKNKEYLIWLKK